MPDRLLLACALIGPLGCRSAATGPSPSPSSQAASTEPLAQGELPEDGADRDEGSRPRIEHADTCAEGSVTIADGRLCVKVPKAYTAAPPTQGQQIFAADDAPPITVRWLLASRTFGTTHADALARMSALDDGAVNGPTRDGSGSFVFAVETQPEDNRVAHAASSVYAGDQLVWCTASAPVKAKLPREFFEACQSLMSR